MRSRDWVTRRCQAGGGYITLNRRQMEFALINGANLESSAIKEKAMKCYV